MNPNLILFLLAGTSGGIAEAGTLMGLNYTQLWTRIGKGVYLLNLANEFRGGIYPADMTVDLPGRWELFVQQYDGESPAIRSTISDSTQQLASAISALGTIPTWVSNSLTKTVIEMLNEAHPLTADTIGTAVRELIAEMRADSKFVNANATTIDVDYDSDNDGDGVLVMSLLDGNGYPLEYVYNETLPLTFTNSFTAGNERAQVLGTLKASSLLSQDWPLGSGTVVALSSLDATTSGNKIAGGSFNTFTVSNTPDSWTLDVGTAGSQFLSEASVIYKGAKALKIAGDGSTLSAMSQALTLSSLKAKTPYAINFWAKTDATPGAGVLTVDLYDGSGVTVDENGVANSFTVDLTTLGTAYVPVNHVFRLSEPLPTAVTVRFRLTTALSSSRSLYLDQLTMQPMTQLYTGGPYVALASGATNWSLDDGMAIDVTNDYAGKLQTAFWRLFNMPNLGLSLPSKDDASENVSDNFII